MYTYGKGGSYVGEFKRGRFDGMGICVLCMGVVKVGLWEDNEFVEVMMVKDCEGMIVVMNVVVLMVRKVVEASNFTMKDLFWKVVKFLLVIVVILVSMMNFIGIVFF